MAVFVTPVIVGVGLAGNGVWQKLMGGDTQRRSLTVAVVGPGVAYLNLGVAGAAPTAGMPIVQEHGWVRLDSFLPSSVLYRAVWVNAPAGTLIRAFSTGQTGEEVEE